MATNVQQPLETNTTDLETLLQQINALPEAGGGGTVGDWDAGDLAAAEIDDQTDILSQLAIVLAGKAGGSGGNNIEQGEFTVDVDTASATELNIPFTNEHDTPPFFLWLGDVSEGKVQYASGAGLGYVTLLHFEGFIPDGVDLGNTVQYGRKTLAYISTSNTSTNVNTAMTYPYDKDTTHVQNIGYYVTNEKLRKIHDSYTIYLKAGRTYKWIAMWL